MKAESLNEALETAAQALGVRVRYENLPPGGVLSGGGLCRVRDEWHLIIDKKCTVSDRSLLIADVLVGMDTSSLTLPKAARDLLEQRRLAMAAATHPPGPA